MQDGPGETGKHGQTIYDVFFLIHKLCMFTLFAGVCVCVCVCVRRASLPDYVLDFGHVVLGQVCTQSVAIANTGWYPVSFSVDQSVRSHFGFSVDLLRVIQLPEREAVDCVVTFDPSAANLGTGPVEVVLPISV